MDRHVEGRPAPGGIPGALSNTPPPGQHAGPIAQRGSASTPAPGRCRHGGFRRPTPQTKQSDSFTRTYETGKEISVTRAVPGNVTPPLGCGAAPRGAGQTARHRRDQPDHELVRATVGYNAQRAGPGHRGQPQVQRRGRRRQGRQPGWYEAEWVPMAARNATALVIALLVLFLGVRPLAKALLKKRDDATQRPALAPRSAVPRPKRARGRPLPSRACRSTCSRIAADSYDDRVGLVRGFTRENPARAALAVRDMIKADAR
jgi:flagellar M-ring protein FliF